MPTTQNDTTPNNTSPIKKLEEERSSRVIVYFTGEKQPPQQFATQIAIDVLPYFQEILENFGKVKKISLVLNTSGGSLEAPWPLVNLVREYCKSFEVIIMEKALSAGTMIALGADRIVMLPYSHLSPVDPSAEIVDNDKKQRRRLEIEDIIGYVDFAKEKIGIAEQSALAEIMKELTKEVSPTMLGSINRTYALVRRLAKNLLDLHGQRLPEKQCKEIVENLTQKLYSHRHLINRKEAKEVVGFGSIIEYAKPETKKIVDDIYNQCSDLMELKKDFDPMALLGADDNEKVVKITRAVIHSSEIKYDFNSQYQMVRTPDPSGRQQIMVNVVSNKWLKNNQ